MFSVYQNLCSNVVEFVNETFFRFRCHDSFHNKHCTGRLILYPTLQQKYGAILASY